MKSLKLFVTLATLFIIVLFIVRKNYVRNQSIEQYQKYTIIKPANIESKGVNQSYISFYLNNIYTGSNTRLIRNYELSSFLERRFLVEYDSTNLKNVKIFVDTYVPDSIKIPVKGWKYKPSWASK